MNPRLRKLLGQRPDEIRDECVRNVARFQGEAGFHSAVIEACDRMLARVQHDQDWWRYAELMQKRADAIAEYNLATDKCNAARAQLDALIGDVP
jgi:hypothetical protein